MSDTDDTQPTPGPWEVRTLNQTDHAVVGPERKVCNVKFYTKPENKANARLIAAAGTAAQEAKEMGYDPVKAVEALPELLEAVDSLLSTRISTDIPIGIRKDLRNALDAARADE